MPKDIVCREKLRVVFACLSLDFLPKILRCLCHVIEQEVADALADSWLLFGQYSGVVLDAPAFPEIQEATVNDLAVGSSVPI